MLQLAHFSDPHLANWSAGGLRGLMNKRLTGLISWMSNRRKIHLSRVLNTLIADLKTQHPDHVVLTGDIVNISALDEFVQARDWLQSWADPRTVTVIPGNHDSYVPVEWQNGIGLWAPYMTGWRSPGDAPGPANGEIEFPFVRVLGEVAIVGVSSAVPMPAFVAAGRIGEEQMLRLRMTLLSLRRQGLFRVVLVHHPPYEATFFRRRKALLDADAFAETLAEFGAELVLHGHTHTAELGRIGDVPVVGVPSASACAASHKDVAAYNVYRIDRDGPRWRILVEIRELSANESEFQSKGQISMTIGSPVHA